MSNTNTRAISRLEYSVASGEEMEDYSDETGGNSSSSPPNKIRRTDKGLPSTRSTGTLYEDGKTLELARMDLKTFETGDQTSIEPQVENDESTQVVQTQVEKEEQPQMTQPKVQSAEPTQMTQPQVEVAETGRVPEPPCNPEVLPGEGILQYCIVMKHPSTGKDLTVPLPEEFQKSIKKGLNESETLNATNGKDEEMYTSEPLQTGDNFGYESPVSSCSSQNSLSSVDFLDKNIRGIARSSEKLGSLSFSELKMVLPKKLQKLLDSWFKDPLAMERLTRFFFHDMESHLMSSGANSAESLQLMQTLKSEDPRTLLLRLGKNLVEGRIVPKKAETQTMPENGKQETENSVFVTDTQEFEASNSESNKNEPDEKSFIEELDKFKYSETEPIPTGSSSAFPEVQPTSQKVLKFGVSLDILEIAYDHIFREVENAKKVEKAGQVLFDVVFSNMDILECRVGGKKNTRTFDHEKKRFIEMIIAWLLTSPTKRSFEEFEKSEDQDIRLGSQDAEVLKKKVFTEHAYRKRRDLKKENTNAQ